MFNFLRTGALLAAMTALFMAVGYFVGGTGGMIIALGVAIVTNLFSYWNADKMVLGLQQAQPIDPRSAPELYRLVERLAQNAGLPTPRIYVIETQQPNAFATGRNPQNAAVAVSRGLMQVLNERELAGVIAHELAHIRNSDTLTMTLTATLAGAISMLAQFGFFFGGANNRNNPLGGIGALLMVFLAPVAAALVQMAVSRTREYEADHDGAAISGEPLALASALTKISGYAKQAVNVPAERNPAMAHLYIINPLSGARMDNLFSTHPAVENRIAQLEQIAAQMGATRPAPSVTRDATPRPISGWRVPATGRVSEPDRASGPWG